MMPSDNTSQQSLTVALRVRPINMLEVSQGARYIAHVVDKHLVVLQDPNDATDDILRQNRSRQKEYLFDCVLGPQTSQIEVYEATTRCLIDSVLSGYNATVFAYGPTGTGKTYTMLGTDTEPGIMVLTLNDLFRRMEQDQHMMKYRATIAYLEVYNEMICDLLQPSSGFLDLREDSKGNVVVAGLLEVETSSTTEVMRLLRVGNERRSCEPTAVNMTSSRSHAVLQVTVEASRVAIGAQQEIQTGRLYMVDLAGSERAAQTQNRGRRMVEGAHINRSLLALGNCINALVGNNKNHYVNYRDSKLTRLLKEALGGNCRTVMIAHVSPASTAFEESRNTLGYADRAKHIKTKVRQNTIDVDYHILQYTAVIADLQQEIAQLRSKCHEPATAGILHSTADEHSDNRSVMEFAQISGELKDILKKQESLRQELQSKDELLLQNSADIQRHKSFELERPDSRNTGSHYSLNDVIANTASSTEVTLLSTNQGKPRNSFSSPLDLYKPQEDTVGGSVSPDGAAMTMLTIPGASGWCGEEALKELSLLYREREQLQEQQKSILERLEQAQSKAVDLKDRLTEYITTDSQHDIFSYLTKINELESDNIHQVRSMSHVRNGMLQVRHLLEQLVQQNRQCMKLVEKQRSLIKCNFSDSLSSVEEQYKQLVEQQQLLSIRLSSSHLQLHPLLDSTKHSSGTTEGELKARLLEADSQCGEESMPQLPVLPGITATDSSSKFLKKMDTVTSLPSLESKTGQSDDSMIRSHSELCLQNGNTTNKVKSTSLPKISKGGRVQQPKYSTGSTHTTYSLAPVRPSNGRGLNTKPFVHSPPLFSYDNNNSHNRNFASNPNQSKNGGRGHFEMKKGIVTDTKVPSSMRKKLLNQNTRRHAMNMGETSVSISKPIESHQRRKAATKREPIKKIPLPIKDVKDFTVVTSNLVASQKPQPVTPPDVSHTSKLPRAIPNGAHRPPRSNSNSLSVTGTGISTNRT